MAAPTPLLHGLGAPKVRGTLRLSPKKFSKRDRPYAERIAALDTLRQQFPTVFDLANPKPLAIGIYPAVAQIVGKKRAFLALRWWCNHPAYRAAVAAGGQRCNLDGTEAEEITEAHRLAAAQVRGRAPLPLQESAPQLQEAAE